MNFLKLIFIISFCFFAMHSMEEGSSFPYTSLTTIDDVPAYYAALALELLQQDFFKGKNSIGLSNIKVLPLNSFDDCRITEILSKNMKSKLNSTNPGGIHAVDSSFGLYYANGKNIGFALIALNASDELYNSNTLKIYGEIVRELKKGWKQENESSECYFFLKDSKLEEEDCLVRFLASRLSLKKVIECDYIKNSAQLRLKYPDKMYLLVKKDAVKNAGKDVNEKLKFQLTLKQESAILSDDCLLNCGK